MVENEEKIVMPGDKLGIIEQYVPGEGTYDDEGEIKSSVLGNVKINQKKRIISVDSKFGKPALLKKGDIVYGQITDLKPQRANINIDCIKDNPRPLALPYMGAIHISQAKKDYLEKLSDAFDLSTVDKDCGVLKAMCTRCRDYMHTTQKKDEVRCNSCNKKEKRKVSINYVNE